MDSAWSTKPWASWRWDAREATQNELQGELLPVLWMTSRFHTVGQ